MVQTWSVPPKKLNPMIHPTADISTEAKIGNATHVWNHSQIREGATIGAECIIGRDVYIDADVRIGNRVKVQNSALIYSGATIEDGVFIGPRACLTNDRHPRAITPTGERKGIADWTQGEIHIGYGASIGAGAVIVTGVHIGRFAMVAAGAVVTQDVPDYGLVMGVPARLSGYVCACGKPIVSPDQRTLYQPNGAFSDQSTDQRIPVEVDRVHNALVHKQRTTAETEADTHCASSDCFTHHRHRRSASRQPPHFVCADCLTAIDSSDEIE